MTSPMKRLPAAFKAVVLDYVSNQSVKREAESIARKADKVARVLKSDLVEAMDGSQVAICGNAVLTLTNVPGSEAKLTLSDGTVIPWADVTSFSIGKKVYRAADVSDVQGGRAGYDKLTVTGSV